MVNVDGIVEFYSCRLNPIFEDPCVAMTSTGPRRLAPAD